MAAMRSATKAQRGPGMLAQLERLVMLAGNKDLNATGDALMRHCIVARYMDCVAADLAREATRVIKRIRLDREAVLEWMLKRRERAT